MSFHVFSHSAQIKSQVLSLHQSYLGQFRMEVLVGTKTYTSSTLHSSQGRPGSPNPPPLAFRMPWRSFSSCLLCSHTWPESLPPSLDIMPDPTPSCGPAVDIPGWKPLCKASLAWAERCSNISHEIWSSHAMLPCGHLYKGSPMCPRNACPGVCAKKSWLPLPTLRHSSGGQMWWLPQQDFLM